MNNLRSKLSNLKNACHIFRHYLRWPYPMYKPSQFDSFNHEHTCLASKLTNIELSDICPLAKAGQPFEVARENTCEECKYFCRIHYEVDPEYLDKLPVNIEIMVNGQKYLLTHAAPEDEYLNSSMKHRDGREFAVWHRYRSHDRGPDDYTVIFGHTPTTEHQLAKPATIWNGRNLIDIDCGAAYEEIDVWGIVIKTRLACLRLDDMKEFYSEEDLNEEGNQRR